jgi:hypothetical protein
MKRTLGADNTGIEIADDPAASRATLQTLHLWNLQSISGPVLTKWGAWPVTITQLSGSLGFERASGRVTACLCIGSRRNPGKSAIGAGRSARSSCSPVRASSAAAPAARLSTCGPRESSSVVSSFVYASKDSSDSSSTVTSMLSAPRNTSAG